MKTNDYLKNILIKIIRDNNIYFIFILVVSTILLITSLSFKNNVNDYIEENINRNINFRTMQVSNKKEQEDLGKKEILEIENVIDVYSSAYSTSTVDSSFANEKLDGKIVLTYLPQSTMIHTLTGSSFDNNDKSVAIIPKEFYPDSSIDDLKINEEELINGEKLLGQTLTIKYYTRKLENMKLVNDTEIEKDFTIVGIYDNREFMNLNNQIFVSQKDLNEIVENKIPKSSEDGVQIIQTSDYLFNVVVNNVNNVENVKQKMIEKGFTNIQNAAEIDNTMVKTIKLICYIIATISILSMFIIIILYIRKKLIKESTYIGTLRTLGYTRNIIKKQYLMEVLLTTTISYGIGAIISIILINILKNTILISLNYIGFIIKLYIRDFLLTFIIIIIISTIFSILMIKNKINKDIINLIESRE